MEAEPVTSRQYSYCMAFKQDEQHTRRMWKKMSCFSADLAERSMAAPDVDLKSLIREDNFVQDED